MLAIQHHTIPTTSLLTWRGVTIRLTPAQDFYVYLIHFDEPYKHARHYLGSTCFLDERLAAHAAGSGARLMEVIEKAGISWELARLWRCESEAEMRALEKVFKHRHGSVQICPRCNPHLAPDPVCMLRAGHYPFHLFGQGKRQPLQKGVSPCIEN